MLDDFGQRIRDIILSEMDLSRELSDEEICDLIGSVVSREARDRPMTIKDRAELERKSRKNPKVQGSFFIGREAGGCDTADCGTP